MNETPRPLHRRGPRGPGVPLGSRQQSTGEHGLARHPRGEYAKSAGRREEIVAAALEVFSEAGYHRGSLRDVADRAGLSQAGLLHHYPSKHRLVEAVLDWRDQDALARMGAEPPRGVAMLRALVDLAEHNETTPQLVELHVTLSAEATSQEHPVHDYFVRRYAAVLEMVTDAFEHAAAHGELQPGVDSRSSARTLVALMDGLQGLWLLDRGAVDMAEELRRYLRPLLTVDLEKELR